MAATIYDRRKAETYDDASSHWLAEVIRPFHRSRSVGDFFTKVGPSSRILVRHVSDTKSCRDDHHWMGPQDWVDTTHYADLSGVGMLRERVHLRICIGHSGYNNSQDGSAPTQTECDIDQEIQKIQELCLAKHPDGICTVKS